MIGVGENKIGRDIGSKDMYKERTKLVLVFLSDLYSKLDLISVDTSRSSSCLILYCHTNYLNTNYYLKQNVYEYS